MRKGKWRQKNGRWKEGNGAMEITLVIQCFESFSCADSPGLMPGLMSCNGQLSSRVLDEWHW